MGLFLGGDDALERRALFVADRGETLGEARGVIEVAALEAEPERGDECLGCGGGGDAVPEPVDRKIADIVPERADARGVHPHVTSLVEEQPGEASAKRAIRIGIGEDRPGEELGSL